MNCAFRNITIKGIQAVAPKNIVYNSEYSEQLGERRCKKQIKITGVSQRHISPEGQHSVDLVEIAARTLMCEIGWSPNEVDVLVFLTQSAEFDIPSTAFYLQHVLGIPSKCVTFDVNLGCTGVVEGIQIVSSMLQQCAGIGKGLVLVADANSLKNINECSADELADSMLFGSAGVCIALEKNDAVMNEMYISNFSDGSRYDALITPKGGVMRMDGPAIFDFGVNEVARDLIEFKKCYGITDEMVDFYSFHQAQKLMLDTIVDSCYIPEEKELRSISEYGNTSGASVALNYCHNVDKLSSYSKINTVMCGFGVGLSWAYLYTCIDSQCVRPVLFTDEYRVTK